jgi:cytochrome P450
VVFNQPDRFDANRFSGRNYRRDEYSPLGIGRHSCLGNQVVDMVGRIFVTELIDAYDIRTIADGPREYGRAHWEPSSSLRLELIPRAA